MAETGVRLMKPAPVRATKATRVSNDAVPNVAASGRIAPVPYLGSDGQYHFLYVTHHIVTIDWYGGRHSTDDLNDRYVGSGNWVQLWSKIAPEMLTTAAIE